jgi:hypothetical protein
MAEPKKVARTRRRTTATPGEGAAPTRASAELRIPRWLPPVLYGAATLWLFRAFVFSNDMLFGSDTFGLPGSLGYVARKFFADALRDGTFPHWNPQILGGTPFLESLAGGDTLYPTSLLLVLMEPHRALGWKLVLHVFVAGLLMFGWVRALGCSRAAALVAGLAYGLAPFLVSFIDAGHDGKVFVISLSPLLFWAAERTFQKRGLLRYVGVALVIALIMFTTHFQMAYFLFGGVGLYYLFRVWQTWRGVGHEGVPDAPAGGRAAARHLALFLSAAVAGVAVAGIQLIPAFDYLLEYSRRTATTVGAAEQDNVAYSSTFALHPEEVMSYVVPEFPGNDAARSGWAAGTYWGRNGLKNNHEAAGLVVLLLAGISFFGAPRRGLRLFLVGLGVLALLFALGRHTPVWRIFYEVLPGISLFRAPGMASFLFGFALVTLSAFGTDRVLAMAAGQRGESLDRAMRYLWIAVGVIALLMLLAASGALFSLWTSVVYRQMLDFQIDTLARARPFIVRGFFVSTLIAAATAGSVWAARKGYLQPVGVLSLLGLLVAIDALRVDAAFVHTLSQRTGLTFQQWSAPDQGTQFLQQRQAADDPFRIASPLEPQDVKPGMYGLELATGHHPNDLARYRELIGMRGSGSADNLGAVDPTGAIVRGSANVIRLLNVRYMLIPGIVPDSLMAAFGWDGLNARIVHQEQSANGAQVVYEVDALPRARLVAEAEVVPDDRAVARILDPGFDPARTAVLPEAPPITLPGGQASGEVIWTERGLNRMSLDVRSDGPALLVLADNWFPSWHARVDGVDAPVLRAYHTLRAVPLEAGQHTVELYYESPMLRDSLLLSLGALALLIAVAVVSLVRSRGRGATPAAA